MRTYSIYSPPFKKKTSMSIATLKKKTSVQYKNMSANLPRFSIQGGYRNQGYVGQSTASRHFGGGVNRGAQCSLENSQIIKPTVSTYPDSGTSTLGKIWSPLCSANPRIHQPCAAAAASTPARDSYTQSDYIAALAQNNQIQDCAPGTGVTYACQDCIDPYGVPNIVHKPTSTTSIAQMDYDVYLQQVRAKSAACPDLYHG